MQTQLSCYALVRKALVVLSLFALPTLASATESKLFSKCFGDHHGSYLSLWSIYGSEGLAQINIGVDGDGEEVPTRFYQVEKVSKNGKELPVSAWSWAIRQAIKAESRGEWFGFILVKAVGPNDSTMYINLQKYSGELRHALVIDGYVESLTCPADSIRN